MRSHNLEAYIGVWIALVIALIDYDNVDVLERRRGVRHVINSLLHAVGRQRIAGERKMDCRLYGGWFERTSLSAHAQRLLPELRREFPGPIVVAGQYDTQTVLVRAELALALACDPRVDLTHTYRRRSLPPRLQCVAAPFPTCADPSRCPVASLDLFIRNDTCPVGGCGVRPSMVLERAEQKLVDSMIIIDLVHLAEATSECLILVSADDDLWPGIRFVLLRGARVIHVVPRRGRSASDRYRRLETARYTPVEI